ncbi:MAG: HlyD family type I secretion periplasmic adaptor subunit [Pseudomonadota bacterium]
MTQPTKTSEYSPALPLFVGVVALVLLVACIGFWSVRTQIAGAIIANGLIEVEHNRQVVQHAEGGTVGVILARDGDRVAAGDVVLRLDDTLLRSDIAVSELQLVELTARSARLEAEREGASSITLPRTLAKTTDDTALAQIAGQQKLFEARLDSLDRELTQISESIAQTRNRIAGTEAQIAALNTQADLVAEDLANQVTLLEKGLVPGQRASNLRRDAARIAGEIGALTAKIAEYRGEIAGFEIERLKRVTTRREDAIAELRDIQFRELELTERLRGLRERLKRLDVRSPVAGIVYGSTVFAEQAVLRPADTLMYIVPQDQPLIVSARVDAIHIDQVHVGQAANLRFPAFNQRTTPEVAGRVLKVSPDVFVDQTTGLSYYEVDVMPLASELAKLNGNVLIPGMPVETFLKTDERTPLSYLTKPLTDYFGRAFRES